MKPVQDRIKQLRTMQIERVAIARQIIECWRKRDTLSLRQSATSPRDY